MTNWLRKVLVTVLSVLLAGLSVVAIEQPALALKGSDFDPGLIISDSVFFDFGTMNADAVQRFLNSQVDVCDDNDGGPNCLRDYKEDIVGSNAIKDLLKSTWEYKLCKTIDPAKDQQASTIIVKVARACGINPRVLLVMLQKEQGLVQSGDPTDYMYKAAMGYGCPDSHPEICGQDAVAGSRLFAQLYRASWQLRWYGDPRGSFTWLKPGRDVSVLYSPRGKSACGTKTFEMKSQATANLYYYTPYTPNKAALNNLYGTGDACSAYGNRNFWRFFWGWFGSPIGGGFLLKSETSDYYLVVNEKKYKFTDKELLKDLAPLGPLGVISQKYLDSFADGGTVGRIIKNDGGTYYYVLDGKKYQFSNCGQAANFGLNCDNAIELTDIQISALETGTKMSSWVLEDPADENSALYYFQGGKKRAVLDLAAVTAAGINQPARISTLPIKKFEDFGWGVPIAPENTVFTNQATKRHGLIHGGKYYEIDGATEEEVSFASWFGSNTRSLNSNSLATIDSKVKIKGIVQDESHNHYIITSAGKRAVSTPADLGITAAQLPATLLSQIPSVATPLQTPGLIRVSGSKTIYWLENGKKRKAESSGTRAKLADVAAVSSIQNIPKAAMDLLPSGGDIYTPGKLLKDSKDKLFLTNGTRYLVSVPSAKQAKLYGLPEAIDKSGKNDLAGYTKSGNLEGLKVQCGTQLYLPVSGVLQPIAADYAAHYPGTVQKLSDITCTTLKFGTTQLGRFVKSPSKLIYLMQDGKRRLIDTTSSFKQYVALRGDTPAVYKIDATAAELLPIGKKVSSTAKTAIPLAEGAAVVIDPAPAPSPSPTPTTTTAAKPNPCKPSSFAYLNSAKTNWYHKVKSGESLGLIADKCGTTVARLDKWNTKITNVNSISVGLVVRVSNY